MCSACVLVAQNFSSRFALYSFHIHYCEQSTMEFDDAAPSDAALTPLLSCSGSLPLPVSFRLRPLWSNARLSSIGRTRWHFPSIITVGVLSLIALWLPASTPEYVENILHTCGLVLLLLWLSVCLTHMDRLLLHALVWSFEWWFLMSNIVMFVVCLLVDIGVQYPVILICIGYCSICLYVFSLDAVVGPTRGHKVCLLATVLVCLVVELVQAQHVDRQLDRSQDFCAFLYCTSTGSLRGTSTTTLAVFTIKYIVLLLWRPVQLMIISARVKCSTGATSEIQFHSNLDEPLMEANENS
jgi:hypothetical protein